MQALRPLVALAAAIALCPPSGATVIGTNTGAESLTVARVARLPARQRAAWAAYLDRSRAQMQADRAALAAEQVAGQPLPPPRALSSSVRTIPLDRDAGWYAGAEARRIAGTIVSFQTPAGGWSKNQDRSLGPRLPGQRYSNDAETMKLDPSDFDAPADRFWTFVGTLDNGATTTEMRFLARVSAALPGADGDSYRASFLKGVAYLLAAQYPNGGWPQIWPLEGGFHDAVTYNDNAVAEAAMLLEEVGSGRGDFAFVGAELRLRAAASARRAVDVVLASQIRVGGKRSCWPQQVDPLTLAPSSARNYEPRSIASAESADILMFLMRQRNPPPAIEAAVRACAGWLEAHKIHDLAFRPTPTGRRSVAEPGAVTWSRNYDIVTGRPIFGDRDKTIHDTVNDLSRERRDSYSWYGDGPKKALAAYARWRLNR
jgi:PelA/Pel-15E family pectate lyase